MIEVARGAVTVCCGTGRGCPHMSVMTHFRGEIEVTSRAGMHIGNWDRLTRFVHNPRIPLDNNATERAIRGPVVGRKNHYGNKSRRGNQVAATLYTLIETAKLHDVDPARYLLEAVRAADCGEVLLPWDLNN